SKYLKKDTCQLQYRRRRRKERNMATGKRQPPRSMRTGYVTDDTKVRVLAWSAAKKSLWKRRCLHAPKPVAAAASEGGLGGEAAHGGARHLGDRGGATC